MDTQAPDSPKNRRLARRYPLRVPVRFRLRRVSDTCEQEVESENLSRRGVFFKTGLCISKGAPVDVLLEMPEEVTGVPAAHWLCAGRVVRIVQHSDDTALGVAVQFDLYEVSRSQKPHWATGAGIRGPLIPKSESEETNRTLDHRRDEPPFSQGW
jgi:hypothetical protein